MLRTWSKTPVEKCCNETYHVPRCSLSPGFSENESLVRFQAYSTSVKNLSMMSGVPNSWWTCDTPTILPLIASFLQSSDSFEWLHEWDNFQNLLNFCCQRQCTSEFIRLIIKSFKVQGSDSVVIQKRDLWLRA